MPNCRGCGHAINSVNGLCYSNSCDCNCPQADGWAESDFDETHNSFDNFDDIEGAQK